MVEYIFFSALVKSSVVAAEVRSAAFHDFIYSIVASTANSLSVFRSIMKSPFLRYSAMAVACTTSMRREHGMARQICRQQLPDTSHIGVQVFGS